MKVFKALILTLTLTGCASDFHLTKFIHIQDEPTHQLYVYSAFAGTFYPLNDPEAEAERLKWLDQHVRSRGLSPDYEIIKREPVLRTKSSEFFQKILDIEDGIYDIYYHVRIPRIDQNLVKTTPEEPDNS